MPEPAYSGRLEVVLRFVQWFEDNGCHEFMCTIRLVKMALTNFGCYFEGIVKTEKGMHSLCNELHKLFKRSRTRIVLLSTLIGASYGGYVAAQGTVYQQPAPEEKSTTSAPCYLGTPGQTPGVGSYNSQMPTGAVPGLQTQEQYGGYSQQGGQSSADQEGMGQASNPTQYGGYSQQGGQSSTDQEGMGQTSNPTMMSTSQIIAILKQAPDMIATLKDIAGQQFGVDPSAISDDGIYNCIQQDSNFRSQAVQELINQGYVANPPQPLSRGETRRPPLPARRVPRVQTAPDGTAQRGAQADARSFSARKPSVPARSLLSGGSANRDAEAVRQRRLSLRYGERKFAADGLACRPRLRTWSGR